MYSRMMADAATTAMKAFCVVCLPTSGPTVSTESRVTLPYFAFIAASA